MSLAVTVGMRAQLTQDAEGRAYFEEELARLDRALIAAGHAPHVEPATFDVEVLPYADHVPYTWLHLLRRAYAHTRPGAAPFAPAPLDFDPMADPLLDLELTVHLDAHLCCHSDAEGYYLPVDLAEIIDGDVTGGLIGSSVALVRELRAVAPLLGIPVTAAGVSSAVAYSLRETDQLDPLHRERITWGVLWATATASVASGALLVFH
ncbi:MAG: hypothetical protein IPL61_26975 [Myxococcales bacterium]|nr:hypothetical protein [Myxococcales bacterium]